MTRGQASPHFNFPLARRDTPAHHLAAIGCTCAVVCVLIFGSALSIAVTASRGADIKSRCVMELKSN